MTAAPVAARRPAPAARWRLVQGDEAAARRLSRDLGVPPLVAQILAARGLGEAEAARAFLAPELTHLHDPFQLLGMDRAVARLVRALETGEQVTVYGDYDVDGVTSTASLVSFLQACGGRVDAYIPRRLEEGYGLNLGAVERLAGQGTRLLVTCDCGVTAVEEVDRAADLGVEVIVIDHHRTPAELPRAAAILNPYQPGCAFPFPHLAAVGVTFNLLMALRKTLREAGFFAARGLVEPRLVDWLDLVALGTVADVVPLTDENRVLVTHGLRRLERPRRPGLVALKQVSGLAPDEAVGAGQVGFRLGPRINAAGRLADARAGLELLLTRDEGEAGTLARLLDDANKERQAIEAEIVEAAAAQAETLPDGPALILSGEGWHRGVVGIVASRMVERFHRPTLVLGLEDGVAQGSGRSVPALHLHDALKACERHLTRYGGHKAAAGLTLPQGALQAFQAAFLAECEARLGPDDLVPVRTLDGEVAPADLDLGLAEALEALAPFGMGHPTPAFVARGVRLTDLRVVGQGSPGHLKARLGAADVIGFGLGDRLALCADGPVDVCFALGVDTWRGRRKVQARLLDLRPAGEAEVVLEPARPRDDAAVGHVHD